MQEQHKQLQELDIREYSQKSPEGYFNSIGFIVNVQLTQLCKHQMLDALVHQINESKAQFQASTNYKQIEYNVSWISDVSLNEEKSTNIEIKDFIISMHKKIAIIHQKVKEILKRYKLDTCIPKQLKKLRQELERDHQSKSKIQELIEGIGHLYLPQKSMQIQNNIIIQKDSFGSNSSASSAMQRSKTF